LTGYGAQRGVVGVVMPPNGVWREDLVPALGLDQRANQRDATLPQIAAPLTLDAYRNNVDPALEAIAGATAKSLP
jgi:hypothetical protein